MVLKPAGGRSHQNMQFKSCEQCAGEYDEAQIQADCRREFGISGDADWSVISLGGMDWSSASNIVFSNGEYDPWKIGVSPSSSA